VDVSKVLPIRQPAVDVLAVGLSIALLLAGGTASAAAEDWPEFRGPTGQGLSAATSLPVTWDLQANVRWKVPIPGKGWSSPIVHDGRIFLTTAVPSEEDPPQRQSLRALGLDAATGDTLWDVEVFVKQMGVGETLHPKNSFASPTPITDGERVFVLFGPDGTACLDRDGNQIWANDSLRYNSQYGGGGSPIFSGPRLIFHCDGARRSVRDRPPSRFGSRGVADGPAPMRPRRDGRSPRRWRSRRKVGGNSSPRRPVWFAATIRRPQRVVEGPLPEPVVGRAAPRLLAWARLRLHRLRGPRRTAGHPADRIRRRDRFACRLADRQQRAAHPVAAGRGRRDLHDQRQRIASCRDVETGSLHWRHRVGGISRHRQFMQLVASIC
jgi:hypothetical protein